MARAVKESYDGKRVRTWSLNQSESTPQASARSTKSHTLPASGKPSRNDPKPTPILTGIPDFSLHATDGNLRGGSESVNGSTHPEADRAGSRRRRDSRVPLLAGTDPLL